MVCNLSLVKELRRGSRRVQIDLSEVVVFLLPLLKVLIILIIHLQALGVIYLRREASTVAMMRH